jgi:ferredoxin-type protein NapG
MKCPPVCPTGALDPNLIKPEKVNMGKATINSEICLNYLYVKEEETGKITGNATICSTCYNVCPFTDDAILMKDFLLPVITEKCVGCGICVEKCPTEPKKAINIIPKGMEDIESAGYYYRKSKVIQEKSNKKKELLKGDDLIKEKQGISSFGEKPNFKVNFEVQEHIEDWD